MVSKPQWEVIVRVVQVGKPVGGQRLGMEMEGSDT